MRAALFTPAQAAVPQNGVIEGGLRDGWAYGLLGPALINGKPVLVIRATPPHQPFPLAKDVCISMADYLRLRTTDRKADHHDMQSLIDAVMPKAAPGKNK